VEADACLVYGFLSPFDAAAFASGSSCPAEEFASPYGRVTDTPLRVPDPNGVSTFRTSEKRPGWVPPLPRGPRCSPDPSRVLQSACAASQRPVPGPRCSFPSAGLHVTRHHRGFTCVHPSGLPLHLWPLDGTAALGLDHLSFAPRRCQRRTSGWGQAIEHRPGLHLRHVDLQSMYPLNSCDLVSHRASSRAGSVGWQRSKSPGKSVAGRARRGRDVVVCALRRARDMGGPGDVGQAGGRRRRSALLLP
jgi:hypothetical protein